MTRRLLFLHGAGGFVDDATLADELGAALNAVVRYPRMPADDMSYESWAKSVRIALSRTRADDVVVGHSFGASILLRVLAETARPTPASVMLLAMPNWARRLGSRRIRTHESAALDRRLVAPLPR